MTRRGHHIRVRSKLVTLRTDQKSRQPGQRVMLVGPKVVFGDGFTIKPRQKGTLVRSAEVNVSDSSIGWVKWDFAPDQEKWVNLQQLAPIPQ